MKKTIFKIAKTNFLLQISNGIDPAERSYVSPPAHFLFTVDHSDRGDHYHHLADTGRPFRRGSIFGSYGKSKHSRCCGGGKNCRGMNEIFVEQFWMILNNNCSICEVLFILLSLLILRMVIGSIKNKTIDEKTYACFIVIKNLIKIWLFQSKKKPKNNLSSSTIISWW